MAAKLPSPKNHVLTYGALAVGGLWFMSRARAQAAAVKGVSRSATQDYSNPVAVAGNFARAIVALTKNLGTTFDPHAVATPAFQTDIAGLGSGAFGSSWNFGSTDGRAYLGDPVFGWSPPNESAVANHSVSKYGSEVDQIPAAPLYSPTLDFVNNPAFVPAGGFDFGGG